jgi:hypothetical protein
MLNGIHADLDGVYHGPFLAVALYHGDAEAVVFQFCEALGA